MRFAKKARLGIRWTLEFSRRHWWWFILAYLIIKGVLWVFNPALSQGW